MGIDHGDRDGVDRPAVGGPHTVHASRPFGFGLFGSYTEVMPRRPPRHDRHAGGPAALLMAKAALRQEVWQAMRDARVARFPGAEGRIPNFTGAEAAAERLRETDVWRSARVIKTNPDAAQ